jgi:transcriptional regulator with PAS, ATPase and Fis domain
LFLDEIGEVSSGLQAKLLRVLEERRFNRVGGTAEIAVDVRVVCATNRDLEAEVARGTFREDLYFRVSAFTILVPPLRDRGADIVPLAELFARQAAAELGCATPVLLPEAVHALRAYRWPGNVRELRNAMERAVVLATGAIGVEHLPDRLRDELAGRDEGAPVGRVRARVAEVEKSAIVEALAANNGNQTRTAAQLGLSRRALIYKLEKYGLKPPPGRR